MATRTWLVFFLLAWVPPALCLTEYVGNNSIVIATSVHPCQLLGDPDLYGQGMRYAFYLSFAACLVGFLFGLVDEFRNLRVSFNILFFTLLVILIRNANRGSFALFEWYVVMGLTLLTFSALFLPFINTQISDTESEDWPSQLKDNPLLVPAPLTPPAAPKTENDNTTSPSEHESDGAQEAARFRELAESLSSLNRLLLNEPIGLGFLLLLYSIYNLTLPWLYFIVPNSGHYSDCPVPIMLFGVFDMYNPHWQRFLRAMAILSVLGCLAFLILGLSLVGFGILSYRELAEAMKIQDEKRDAAVKRTEEIIALLGRREAEDRRRGESDGRGTGDSQNALLDDAQILREIARVRRLELAAGADETALRELMEAVEKWKDELTVRLWAWRFARVFMTVVIGAAGGVSIWFVERTLDLNGVDMDDAILSSSGQLLSLLVAVFTTTAFVWETVKGRRERARRRRRTRQAISGFEEISNRALVGWAMKRQTWEETKNRLTAWQESLRSYIRRPVDVQAGSRGGDRQAVADSAGSSSAYWFRSLRGRRNEQGTTAEP